MARHSGGWIKTWRNDVEEVLAKDGFTLAIYLRILLWAHWKDSETRVPFGKEVITLNRGQLITGLKDLRGRDIEGDDPYLNRTRASLTFLEKTGRIQQVINNHGRLITVCNWDEMQSSDETDHKPITNEAQTKHKRCTNDPQLSEEVKKLRRKKEEGESAIALPRLAEIWNQQRGTLPQVRGCSSTRKKSAELRWKENPDETYWVQIIKKIVLSDFCNGKNDRGWRADFDFLIQPESQHKVLEGKYDNRSKAASIVPPPLPDPFIQNMERIIREVKDGTYGTS